MEIDRRKYLYRIKRLEIKSWLKYLMIEGKSVVDYVLGELMTGTDITIDNTIEKKLYKFDIKGNSTQETTTGKNMYEGSQDFSGTWTNNNSWTTDGEYNGLVVKKRNGQWEGISKAIEVVSGETYTFSLYVKSDANRTVSIYLLGGTATVSTSSKEITSTTSWKRVSLTFTASSNGTIKPRLENINVVANNYTYICGYQLEKSSTMTDYEPYTNGASPNPSYPQTIYSAGDDGSISEKIENSDGTQSQTYTIPVQQPMRSIGEVRDEFIQVNGNWFERHNIGKVVLDGTQGTFSKPATNRFNIDNAITDYLKAYNKTNYVSNQYICYSQQGNNAGFDGLVTNVDYGLDLSSGTTSYTIRIKDTRYNDVNDFKTWLSNNNLEIIYELATPTDLPCTAEQIAILENLPKSYNEQTNIYSLDVTPAYVEAQAYVKKEEVIEND